jgi:hypothetical protein
MFNPSAYHHWHQQGCVSFKISVHTHFTTYLVQQVSMMGALLLTFLFYIWQELRDKRKREGLSIESAAEICVVDPSTYARWERGKQYPHPRNRNVLMEKIDPYEAHFQRS